MGGGVMRAATASKVAGVSGGVILRGLRGSPAVPPVEQALRKSAMPASAILSSSSSSSAARATVSDVPPIQMPAWEMDGWEDDLVMTDGEPLPRVVFAGAPSFDEAKEATIELKDALDKVYLSPHESSESGEVVAANQLSGLSLCSDPNSETKTCLIVDTGRGRPVPNHALKAFKFLSRSSEAQTVVASLATDLNVWNAVMQNPVLQDFMQANKNNPEFQEQVFPENVEKSSEGMETGDSENWFMSMLENFKVTVVELVSNLSSSFQNIFGFSSDVNENIKSTATDITLGASFMGLVTLVVMVVLLKRV
ncbi:uncharacterized protein LOC21403998 [Morus notabilis]|uniref:uncharacterized protein LOC21403998 n=1 Tax=Morus notabilis TaxID=981085 RepID=UPI000CED09BB|nr:uncharacterized protein LOC21403998 [Morus notabilis]